MTAAAGNPVSGPRPGTVRTELLLSRSSLQQGLSHTSDSKPSVLLLLNVSLKIPQSLCISIPNYQLQGPL